MDVGEEPDFERSMEELASLAEAAEKEVVGQIVQRLDLSLIHISLQDVWEQWRVVLLSGSSPEV